MLELHQLDHKPQIGFDVPRQSDLFESFHQGPVLVDHERRSQHRG